MSIKVKPPINKQRFVINGQTMGTRFCAIFFADINYDAKLLADELQACVDKVDAEMSNFKPESDLSRFNNSACDIWVEMPKNLLYVVNEAMKISQISNGSFDISVGDIVNAWGFGAANNQPDEKSIATVAIGNRPNILEHLDIDFDLKRMRKTQAMTLDLCGIAKGFGVDELAKVMTDAGTENFLVSIDGEMRAAGHKPDEENWSIAVEKPLKVQRDVSHLLTLCNESIATSGDYRHLRSFANRQVSHTISQHKAAPLDNNITSLSVIMPTCLLADAWATALMVMGFETALEFANRHEMEVLFMLHKNGYFVEFGTGRFDKTDNHAG
ncbi:MAG: FAD:protein FMN transferase [Hyphomicrobiales bacterium]|nr:FAD:protein FMN transferase [Hyphomicrobiales bacterium]